MKLDALIQQAYPSPEWAVFSEVANTTGFGASRRADAVALGIWQSRGFALIGFEFKEDRRDWLREKANPQKADTIAAHCDSWYVVAGSKDVVKVEELPEPWGLLYANESRTKLMNGKVCQPFPDRDKTVIKRSFAASMLRKVADTTVPKSVVAAQIEEAVKQAVERTNVGRDTKNLHDRIDRLENIIDTFKAETGVDMTDWRGPKDIANAVRAVINSRQTHDALTRAETGLEYSLKAIRTAIKDWPSELLAAK